MISGNRMMSYAVAVSQGLNPLNCYVSQYDLCTNEIIKQVLRT